MHHLHRPATLTRALDDADPALVLFAFLVSSRAFYDVSRFLRVARHYAAICAPELVLGLPPPWFDGLILRRTTDRVRRGR